jgi:hypothetical protein
LSTSLLKLMMKKRENRDSISSISSISSRDSSYQQTTAADLQHHKALLHLTLPHPHESMVLLPLVLLLRQLCQHQMQQ